LDKYNILSPYNRQKGFDIMKEYPEYILRTLRQREGLEETDTSMDDKFNNYSPNKVFKEILEWEGIIGWDNIIKSWIRDIYGVDLNNR